MLSQNMRGVSIQILIVGAISSILYLWGYWYTFGIIIFEYANLKDIITATGIVIFLSFGVFYMIGVIMGSLPMFIPGMEKKLEPGAGRKTKEGQFLWRWRFVFFAIYCVLLLYIWFYVPLPRKALIFPGLFALGFGTIAQHTEFLSDIKDFRIRNIFIYFSLFMIIASYLFGKLHAKTILDSGPKTFYEIESKRKYLGHTNGYFFLLSSDNSKVFIIRSKSLENLVLTRDKDEKGVK